jgi:hypothetical protein
VYAPSLTRTACSARVRGADVTCAAADLVVEESVTHQLVAAGGAGDPHLALTLTTEGTAGTSCKQDVE